MSPKRYAQTREAVAADRISDATAAAMVAQVYALPRRKGGMDLSAADASRRAAMVSLGKRFMLFRLGSRMEELPHAVEELVVMLRKPKNAGDRPIVDLDVRRCAWVATAAIYELTFDRCGTCLGRGQVVDHTVQGLEGRQPMRECGTCHGQKRRQLNEDERIGFLARAINPLDHGAAAKILRHDPRLKNTVMNGVSAAKSVLLEAERIAVEGAGLMVERWGVEDVG